MRRYIISVLILLAALALTTCGGGGDDGGGDIIGGQPCDLMITEIMNYPSGTLVGNEWIELHNPTTKAIDLTDVWIRTDEDARLWLLKDLLGPVMIQPGEYFLVWQVKKDVPIALAEDGSFRVLYLPEDQFDLKKSDLTISLRTEDGTELHKISIGAAGSSCDPAAPTIAPLNDDTKGASIELQEGFLGCTDSILKCEAWGPAWKNALIPGSSDRGTPGQGPETKPTGASPTPGSLAVTEIMSASGEACGKIDWFELFNPTGAALSLEGCTFGDGTASGDTVVKSPVIVPAGGYAVLAQADMDGVDEDGIISGPNLNKTGDTLYLICGGAKILEVTYGGGEGELPKPQDGKSIGVCFDSLGEPYTVATLHDPVNWAVTDAGASGCGDDIGSPGVKNILCHCAPACTPGLCGGDDSCGSLCGCGENGTCVDGGCVCDVAPDCAHRECGDDGCGGSCGACSAGLSCAQGGGGAWCTRTPGAGEVAPTEIMSNGGDTCGKIDWFELKNLADVALDLEGCTVGDDAATGTHVFSSALVIPAGGEIVIAGADMAGVNEDYVTSKPNLNQSNERLWLTCPDGAGGAVSLFEVWYGTGKAGDLPGTAKGVSIQVCPDSLPTPATVADYLAGANWQLTTAAATGCGDDLGTPGMPNPYCACDPTCTPGQCGMADGCGGDLRLRRERDLRGRPVRLPGDPELHRQGLRGRRLRRLLRRLHRPRELPRAGVGQLLRPGAHARGPGGHRGPLEHPRSLQRGGLVRAPQLHRQRHLPQELRHR
ncbi:MAG: lamin tail domain-containing protein [Pseudomonadota bacterium]